MIWNSLPFKDTEEVRRLLENLDKRIKEIGGTLTVTTEIGENDNSRGQEGLPRLATMIVNDYESYDLIIAASKPGLRSLTKLKLLAPDLQQVFQFLENGLYDLFQEMMFVDGSGYFEVYLEGEWHWYDAFMKQDLKRLEQERVLA